MRAIATKVLPPPAGASSNTWRAVLTAASTLGFDKYRLTGGEPTVRPSIVEIVERMRALPNTREIAMTTNGIRLRQLAEPLRRGATADDLSELIRAGIYRKPWGHELGAGVIPLNRIMSEIGG